MKEVKVFSEWLKTLNNEDVDFLVRLEAKEKILFNLVTLNTVFLRDGQFVTLAFSKEEGYTLYLNEPAGNVYKCIVDKDGTVLDA